jgi:hypothetical protein
MGASRELGFATFVEPALFLSLTALALATSQLSLNGMLGAPLSLGWSQAPASLAMVGVSLFIVMLAEASRGPVDDPATHLELTMIHEVTILDHGGPTSGCCSTPARSSWPCSRHWWRGCCCRAPAGPRHGRWRHWSRRWPGSRSWSASSRPSWRACAWHR